MLERHCNTLPSEDPESILQVAKILRGGGIVALPTDTVYGLSASVFQSAAIERIFDLKERPGETRVPVLLASAADLSILVSDIPSLAWRAIEFFWPGALTLVLPARPSVSRSITRGGGTVAVRVPANRACLELLETLGEPIVGTSANVSGKPPARRASEVVRQFTTGLDAVLVDDRQPNSGLPSTVIQIDGDEVLLLRQGAIHAEKIRETLGVRVLAQR